jgi:RloB-like protein
MPRERRDFVRRTGFRDASLVVIACEGAVTEPKYFNGLKERLHSPRMHVEVVTRQDPTQSSPDAVLHDLDAFAAAWFLRNGDALWLVIDRDPQSWKPGMIADVAQRCHQKGYFLALSNPCFELWLLLHFEDVPAQSEERCRQLLENADGLLKREEAQHRRPNSDWEYIDHFLPHTETAIQRAQALDTEPEARWPAGLGTRVYRLVELIRTKSAAGET